jgi:hypothetical protein
MNMFVSSDFSFFGIVFNTSSVCIETGYGLDGRGSIRVRDKDVSLHHRVQTGSGAHPASYPMGTVGFVPGSKAAGA